MYVRELDLFVTVILLEDTPAVTRKTLRRSRILLPLDQWSKPTSRQRWQEDQLQHSELRTLRNAVLFTAVNPMFIDHYREKDYDVTQPRIAVYKNNWKVHQNSVLVLIFEGCDHLLQHFTCGVHREGGDQEVRTINCIAKRISLLLYRKELY